MINKFDINNFQPFKNYVIDASAGTGKTHNIIEIVKKLVFDKVCPLNEILIVTFTDKACGELKDRVRKELGDENTQDTSIYTIHSFCDNVIREFGVSSNLPLNLTLVSDDTLCSFINNFIRRDEIAHDILEAKKKKLAIKITEFNVDKFVDYLCDGIKKYYLNKNNDEDDSIILISDDSYEDYLEEALANKYLKNAYISYLDYNKENNYKTFDYMIREVREAIIDSNCNLKIKLREKYKYAIIDEFQDTNQLQYDIFRNIFMCSNHNIIVVGDPKQSIYSFQGADLSVYFKAKSEIINQGGIECVLTKNYRSRKEQVEACNNLFQFYNFENIKYIDSDYCKMKEDGREFKCLYDCKPIEAFWIANNMSHQDYGKLIASEIAKCCEFDKTGKTRLQITDKEDKEYNLRNVSFRDFAILTRDRNNQSEIIKALKKIGIPFIAYKDKKLFGAKECADWKALFEAIDIVDFTGNNLNILKKALFTNFFGKSLDEIALGLYKTSENSEISKILKWKGLAEEKKWEDLVNDVIVNSDLTKNMTSLSKLNSLGIYKQIGNYCIDYLLDNHNIIDLIKKLEYLMNSNDDNDDNIVEKCTNFNAVKIMTMHASKGLQFPVVITKGGYTISKKAERGCFQYRENGNKFLTYKYKDKIVQDILEEQKRLFYVSYTRGEYITVIESPTLNNGNIFRTAIEKYQEDYPFRDLDLNSNNNISYLKEIVKNTLSKTNNEANISEKEMENQKNKLEKLVKVGAEKKVYKHSYSSLSHTSDSTNDNENKEGEKNEGLARFDKNSIYNNQFLEDSIQPLSIPQGFPKGANVGTCLHEIFEKIDFCNYKEKLDDLVDYSFKNYSIKNSLIYKDYVKKIIENVILSKMPIIHGSKITSDYMSLNTVELHDRKSEIEFSFNVLNQKLRNYCNGFIDLIFKKGDYYSLVDWKSDCLSDDFESFADITSLREHVNDSYSIQRTLYSYCLIKWLKCFYKDETLEDVFENHFGGIYYVFIRGCNEHTGNGIYCQTWNSFSDLEKAFNEIINNRLMR